MEKLKHSLIINYSVIIIATTICILINAVDIFTIKYGIDSEHATVLGLEEMFKISGRIGLYILSIIFPMGSYQIIS